MGPCLQEQYRLFPPCLRHGIREQYGVWIPTSKVPNHLNTIDSTWKIGPNSMAFTTTPPASPEPDPHSSPTQSLPEMAPPESGQFPTREHSDSEMAETSTSSESNGGQDRNHRRRSETPQFASKKDVNSDFEMTEISISSGSNGSQATTVHLPRYLRRAPSKHVTSDALEAIDPGLKVDAKNFILDSFKFLGPR